MAELLEVIFADAHDEDRVEDGREVGQRADHTKRRGAVRTGQAPGGGVPLLAPEHIFRYQRRPQTTSRQTERHGRRQTAACRTGPAPTHQAEIAQGAGCDPARTTTPSFAEFEREIIAARRAFEGDGPRSSPFPVRNTELSCDPPEPSYTHGAEYNLRHYVDYVSAEFIELRTNYGRLPESGWMAWPSR